MEEFHKAAWDGDLQAVKNALDQGVDVEAKSNDKVSTLDSRQKRSLALNNTVQKWKKNKL